MAANMSKQKTARAVALDALNAFETGGVFSASKLSDAVRRARLDRRDAAFANFLVCGVLQNMLLLDWHIAACSNIPLRKLEKRVLCILRLGAFQLFFADGVPARAAVGETVSLCGANRRAAGYCNAVLRALSRIEDPRAVDIPDAARRISVLRSCPEWIVREAIELCGESGADELLAASNVTPPVTLQINPLRTNIADAKLALEREGETVSEHPFLQGALELESAARLASSRFMADGGGWVQDAASFLAVKALSPRPGDRILDVCAAPGGKSFAAYALAGGDCRITACDISERKLALVAEGAARLGFGRIETRPSDGTVYVSEFYRRFDRVICDVPCSGLGIIRKKPDIRYRPQSSAEALPELQLKILNNAAKYLKSGGTLLYSTCTWRRAEDEDVVREFLAAHSEFALQSFDICAPTEKKTDGMLTLMPHLNKTDGFFICLLRKNNV